jgi:hypothetical protein
MHINVAARHTDTRAWVVSRERSAQDGRLGRPGRDTIAVDDRHIQRRGTNWDHGSRSGIGTRLRSRRAGLFDAQIAATDAIDMTGRPR